MKSKGKRTDKKTEANATAPKGSRGPASGSAESVGGSREGNAGHRSKPSDDQPHR